MIKYIFKFKKALFGLIVMSPIVAFLSVSFAFVQQSIIDSATSGSMDEFIPVLMLAVGYVIINNPVAYLNRCIREHLFRNTIKAIKDDLFTALIKKDLVSFKKQNSANYIAMLNNDINMYSQDYLHNVGYLFYEVFEFGFAAIALVMINPLLSVGIFAFSVLPILVPVVFGKKISLYNKRYSDNIGKYTAHIKDAFSGFETIKSFNVENRVLESHSDVNYEVETSKFRSKIFNMFVDTISFVLGDAMFIGILLVGGYFVIQGDMTIGSMMAVVQLMVYITNPLMSIPSVITKIKSAKCLDDKFKELLKGDNSNDQSDCLEFKTFNKSIEFKGVRFSYEDGGKTILNGLDLSIVRGKKYAIVGGSGSGKSTVLKLLLGTYKNFEGEILIDGVDNKKIKTDDLYKNVSIYNQNIFIFDDTLRNNIALYKDYTDEEILEAIRRSGLSEFLEGLPSGINTLLGEGGCTLSGGEKQRIALARCLIRNSSVLILDEATSNLDNITSYNIENSILSLQDVTEIFVTHKFNRNTLEKFDSIIVLKDGQVIENDTFNNLIEDKGYFYSLFNVME